MHPITESEDPAAAAIALRQRIKELEAKQPKTYEDMDKLMDLTLDLIQNLQLMLTQRHKLVEEIETLQQLVIDEETSCDNHKAMRKAMAENYKEIKAENDRLRNRNQENSAPPLPPTTRATITSSSNRHDALRMLRL